MDEPILTNEDMKKIREGFNQSRLPEEMFSKVVGWVKDKVEKGILKIDDAVKAVMGWDSNVLANEIKTNLYNWQYEAEAKAGGWYAKPELEKRDYMTAGESFATPGQEVGEAVSFMDNEPEPKRDKPIEKIEWPTIEYNPSRFDPPDGQYRMVVGLMQHALEARGFLARGSYQRMSFDEATYNAYLRFLNSEGIKPKKGMERVVTPEILNKILK